MYSRGAAPGAIDQASCCCCIIQRSEMVGGGTRPLHPARSARARSSWEMFTYKSRKRFLSSRQEVEKRPTFPGRNFTRWSTGKVRSPCKRMHACMLFMQALALSHHRSNAVKEGTAQSRGAGRFTQEDCSSMPFPQPLRLVQSSQQQMRHLHHKCIHACMPPALHAHTHVHAF